MAEYQGLAINLGEDVQFCPTDLRQGYTGDRVDNAVRLYIQSGRQVYSPEDLGELIGGGAVPG